MASHFVQITIAPQVLVDLNRIGMVAGPA